MKKQFLFFIMATALLTFLPGCKKDTKYSTLIITGQNNHKWKESSVILKQILDETGLFSSEIMITPEKGGNMNKFNPNFSKYKLVVLDYNGDSWSDNTNAEFLKYVKDGGGVVIYHAADNSFPEWKEYNEIIGLGGWGNRTEKNGPYIYLKGNDLVYDSTAGVAGSHGKKSEYIITNRIVDHPITKGLPVRWLHGSDELYSQLRGPGKNMQILATAFSDSIVGVGTMRNEPLLMIITYGKGRIFHTAMGDDYDGAGPAMQCAGFITTLQRGAEWAVTGNVTQIVPFDFPSAAGVVLRPDYKEITLEEAMANIGNYDIGKSTKYLSCIQSHIRNLAGSEQGLRDIEKMMDKILVHNKATVAAKKLLLRELSWMGSDYSIPAIKKLVSNAELKDEAEYALARLQPTN